LGFQLGGSIPLGDQPFVDLIDLGLLGIAQLGHRLHGLVELRLHIIMAAETGDLGVDFARLHLPLAGVRVNRRGFDLLPVLSNALPTPSIILEFPAGDAGKTQRVKGHAMTTTDRGYRQAAEAELAGERRRIDAAVHAAAQAAAMSSLGSNVGWSLRLTSGSRSVFGRAGGAGAGFGCGLGVGSGFGSSESREAGLRERRFLLGLGVQN
jgi:hypothetical protein